MSAASPLRALAIAVDKEALAEAAARYLVRSSAEAIRARGRFVISLAGGSTPRDLYRRLAAPPFADAIDWRKWRVIFSDERCVPPDHPDSNFRMANEALLSHVGLEPGAVIRVAGEREDPASAAAEYTDAVRTLLRAEIDLSLLGIGEDGHTASLFPDVLDACLDPSAIATAVFPQAKQTWRVTLNLPILCAARNTMFLVAGAGKRAILSEIVGADSQLPAARVWRSTPKVAIFADRAAYQSPR